MCRQKRWLRDIMMHRHFKMQIIDSLLQSEEFLPYIDLWWSLYGFYLTGLSLKREYIVVFKFKFVFTRPRIRWYGIEDRCERMLRFGDINRQSCLRDKS